MSTRTAIAIGEELGRATAETETRLLEHVWVLSGRLIAAETAIADLTRRLEATERRNLRQTLHPVPR